MAKRMISPDWKKLRALPGYLQRAWFYIWDKSDAAGVYHFDEDYLKLDLKLKETVTLQDLARLPECKILPGERILIENFLIVNYGHLRPDYNPHKPAYRDLEKNRLILNSSLNQACIKQEEEDEDKEEDKGEEIDEEVFTTEDKNLLVSKLCSEWYLKFPRYTKDKSRDRAGMGQIINFIWEQAEFNPLAGNDDQGKTLATLLLIADQVNQETFWVNKPLISIARNIQEFYNKIKNPLNGKENTGGKENGTLRTDVQAEFERRRAKRQQAGN